MRTHRLLLAIAVPLALAACSGDGGDAAASRDPAGPATEAAAETTGTRPSPIEEFMGWDVTFSTEATEEELAQQRDIEERIAACMQAEGFEYIARDPSADPTGLSEIMRLPPDEFAERYGYGISTIDVRAEVQSADPNDAIVDGLSDPARREYFLALNGAAATAEKYGEPPPADPDAQPGCQPQAERAVYGDSIEKPQLPADLDALSREIDALWDTVLADPRVADAAAAWGECMAAAGHPELARPEDARFEVTRRLYQLHGLEPPAEAPQPERPGRRGLPVEPLLPGPRGGEEPDPAALDELRQYEVAVAQADRGCRPAYDDVVADVRAEVEQAFIDQHRAELEHYRDAIALASGEG